MIVAGDHIEVVGGQPEFRAVGAGQVEQGDPGAGGQVKAVFTDQSIIVAAERGDAGVVGLCQGKGWLCLLYTSPSPRDRG